MDQYGDTRKLSLPSGSLTIKKSTNFLRDVYSLAQNTFNAPNSQYGQGQPSGLSQHFNNSNNYHVPPQQQQQHLLPPSAVSQHQPQQWPRPPPSPNRPSPSQTPSPGPYMHGHPQGPQRPVSPNYVPGQGMISVAQHGSYAPPLPQRYPSAAAVPQQHRLEDLPPPPPYPGHSIPTPPPQQQYQQGPQMQNISPVSTGTSVSQHQSHSQPGWSPPLSQQQTPIQQHQHQQTWNQSQQPSQPQQSQQHAPQHPPPPPLQHMASQPPQAQYQAYSPPLQQSNHPIPPQRHPTAPNLHSRPEQFQPHHSNSYPSATLPAILRPQSSHGRRPSQEPAPPLPARPTSQSTSPSPQQYHQPPVGYAELPSPPPQQQGQYCAPPPGIAEMYAAPPASQQYSAGYSELAGNEPSGMQQGRIHGHQTAGNDVKVPVHQGYGLGIPQIAELPA